MTEARRSAHHVDATRRTFLKASMASGVALSAPAVLGASRTPEKYRTALIGSGWWGMNILREAIKSGRCRTVALCDVDRRHLDGAWDEVNELSGEEPKKYHDYRELLEEEEPDIVINATPDHWHARINVDACEAGADVFVEKPVGHTVMEGLAMVKAARRTGRMVQVGTHRRVSPHNKSGLQFLRSGKVGRIGMVRSFVHYHGGPGEPVADTDPPDHLDWDFWCGPAPLVPFNPAIHPRGFRQFLNFANGTLGDWGIHWTDQILWWAEEKHPRRIHSGGGRHIRGDTPDDAPDTQIAIWEFDSFTATWEHRRYAGNEAENHNIGCYFYGTNGTFHMGWQDGWTFYPRGRGESPVHEEPTLHAPDDQNIRELWADFLHSIETREPPVCDIEVGHLSTNMPLLAMIALKLGRSLEWDGERHEVIDDPEANALLRRDYREPWAYPEV